MPTICLNHHSAVVVPFVRTAQGGLNLLFEQKDSRFNPPYFDNGLCFIGGNWQRNKHRDLTAVDTLKREVSEEYWLITEESESLHQLIGENLTREISEDCSPYPERQLAKIRHAARTLLKSPMHAADLVVKISPPIVNEDLVYGLTVFTNELEEAEYENWRRLLEEFNGKVTTDNLRWGSLITDKSLAEILTDNRQKFAYGYDHVLNYLLHSNAFGDIETTNLEVLQHRTAIQVRGLEYAPEVEKVEKGIGIGTPTYESLSKHGVEYRQQN